MTKKPFTLIELLTVIVVIAIISAMTLPTLLNQSSAQLLRAGNRQLRSAMIATRSYAVEHQMAASLFVYNYNGGDGEYGALQMYQDKTGSTINGSFVNLPTGILVLMDEASSLYVESADAPVELDSNVKNDDKDIGYFLHYYANGTMSESSNPTGNMWGSIKIMAEGAEAATDVYRGLEINKLTNAVRVYGP